MTMKEQKKYNEKQEKEAKVATKPERWQKSFKASHKKYCQTVDLDDVLLQLAEHVGGVGLPGPGHLDDDGRLQQADV